MHLASSEVVTADLYVSASIHGGRQSDAICAPSALPALHTGTCCVGAAMQRDNIHICIGIIHRVPPEPFPLLAPIIRARSAHSVKETDTERRNSRVSRYNNKLSFPRMIRLRHPPPLIRDRTDLPQARKVNIFLTPVMLIINPGRLFESSAGRARARRLAKMPFGEDI